MIFRLLVLALLVWVAPSCSPADPPPDAETVFVVHGLGRTSASMALLGSRLEAAGYRVVQFGYPSTEEPIEELTARLADALVECCEEMLSSVHFVTHSMGGILVRSYLSTSASPHQGRVVMLSPPSQGSEIIDTFADSPLLPLFLGPAGAALGTDSTSVPSRLGPVDFALGVITGSRSMSPIGSWLIPGPDDGKVAVSRAWSAGADDFIVVPATHTFIMNRRDVAAQTIKFLQDGRFVTD